MTSSLVMEGRYATVEPLDPAIHGESLWAGSSGAANEHLWQYLFDGPFARREEFQANLEAKVRAKDYLFFAIVDNTLGRATGYASYLREEPKHRVIEVGSLLFTPALQRTRPATEAMYLMAKHVFEDLAYRRYEWKCNALNAPSRRAALRLGFTFEGIFRQHMLVKGENRDTAWFSMLDREWPARKAKFDRWLDPENFDEHGRQKTSLNE